MNGHWDYKQPINLWSLLWPEVKHATIKKRERTKKPVVDVDRLLSEIKLKR